MYASAEAIVRGKSARSSFEEEEVNTGFFDRFCCSSSRKKKVYIGKMPGEIPVGEDVPETPSEAVAVQ